MRFEIIHVLVDRWTWINLILDPIQSGHQHRGEGIVRIAGRVWEANFDPLGLRIRGIHRNPNARTPVPTGIGQVDRSEEHTSELQSQSNLVCRLLLEKKKKII